MKRKWRDRSGMVQRTVVGFCFMIFCSGCALILVPIQLTLGIVGMALGVAQGLAAALIPAAVQLAPLFLMFVYAVPEGREAGTVLAGRSVQPETRNIIVFEEPEELLTFLAGADYTSLEDTGCVIDTVSNKKKEAPLFILAVDLREIHDFSELHALAEQLQGKNSALVCAVAGERGAFGYTDSRALGLNHLAGKKEFRRSTVGLDILDGRMWFSSSYSTHQVIRLTTDGQGKLIIKSGA